MRDGFGIFDDLIGRYCGHNLPQTITSSFQNIWVRFVTDDTIEGSGIEATFTSTPSELNFFTCKNAACFFFNFFSKSGTCGEPILRAEENVKELILPRNSDDSVMKGVNCMWKIKSDDGLHLQILDVDLSPMSENGLCLNDKLELSTSKVLILIIFW